MTDKPQRAISDAEEVNEAKARCRLSESASCVLAVVYEKGQRKDGLSARHSEKILDVEKMHSHASTPILILQLDTPTRPFQKLHSQKEAFLPSLFLAFNPSPTPSLNHCFTVELTTNQQRTITVNRLNQVFLLNSACLDPRTGT